MHLGPVSIQMVFPPSDYFSVVSLSRNSSTGRLPEDTGYPDATVTFHVSQSASRDRQHSPAAGLGPLPCSSLPDTHACPVRADFHHAVDCTHVPDLLVFSWLAKPTQNTPSITVVLTQNSNGGSFTLGLVKAVSPLD